MPIIPRGPLTDRGGTRRADPSTRRDRLAGARRAFEEPISFHGGLGGPQTRPCLLYPSLPEPSSPIIGAEHVHEVLAGWRAHLKGASIERGVGEQAATEGFGSPAPASAGTSAEA